MFYYKSNIILKEGAIIMTKSKATRKSRGFGDLEAMGPGKIPKEEKK